MPPSVTWREAVRLLRRLAVLLPIVVGIGVFAFLSLRAPARPKLVNSAPLATQFPAATPGASPTLGPPAATPTPDREALGRDAVRKEHVAQIAAGLEDYFVAHGTYPDSGGNVQSLCAYENTDAGCKLQEFIDRALLRDPLGPYTYQYVSDGARWTLFAEIEAIQPGDRCTDPLANRLPHPERTYCLTGGAPAPTSTVSP
jgi:hypothetical protein